MLKKQWQCRQGHTVNPGTAEFRIHTCPECSNEGRRSYNRMVILLECGIILAVLAVGMWIFFTGETESTAERHITHLIQESCRKNALSEEKRVEIKKYAERYRINRVEELRREHCPSEEEILALIRQQIQERCIDRMISSDKMEEVKATAARYAVSEQRLQMILEEECRDLESLLSALGLKMSENCSDHNIADTVWAEIEQEAQHYEIEGQLTALKEEYCPDLKFLQSALREKITGHCVDYTISAAHWAEIEAYAHRHFFDSKQQLTELRTELCLGYEWDHIGFGDFGYTYADARDKKEEKNGVWRLPSREEMRLIEQQEGAYSTAPKELLLNEAYWTQDRAQNGYYGYCFGETDRCQWVTETSSHVKDYPSNDGLAILLIRKKGE